MASENEKRNINDLRVVDLRAELEKRNLDKAGVKAVLMERLQKAIKDEGQDPEEYLFETSEKKTPSKKAPEIKHEENHNADGDAEEDVDEEIKEDTKKGDEEEEEEEDDEEKVAKPKSDENLEKKPVVVLTTDPAIDAKLESPANAKTDKQQNKVDETADKNVAETNGVDNEDSINLTIGEDEEKLLAEEEDSSSQDKESKVNVEGAAARPDGAGDAPIVIVVEDEPEGQQEDAGKDAGDGDRDKDSESKKKESLDEKSAKGTAASSDAKALKEDKDKNKKSGSSGSSSSSSSRNLWVSGLSSSTRATDLKQVFSKYGKVIGAKVVTNARTPGARCYGYVTMATSEDASKCIQHLHRTELHGRMISVERTKGDATGPPRKGESSKQSSSVKRHERKPSTNSSKEAVEKKKEGDKEEEKKEGDAEKGGESSEAKDITVEGGEKADGEENNAAEASKTSGGEQKGKEEGGRRHHSREVSDDRRHRSAGSSHYSQRSHSPRRSRQQVSPSRRPGVLTFAQIRDERERQRQRERERELREEDRRRRDEVMRQREIEKRHREEAMRLEREKEKLRVERERIERERSELMRLERERQRQERERLEREREELKRQQMRFEETRRTVKRPSSDRRDPYPEERKRVASERRYDATGRFDDGARFERNPTFRVREERRAEGEHRSKVDVRHSRDRYPESSKGDNRYTDRSGDTWHTGGGPAAVKPFSSMGSGGVPPRDSWGPSGDRKADGQNWGRPMDSGASDRWVSGSSGPMGVVGRGGPSMGPGSMYSNPQNVAPNMSGMNMGMSGGSGPYPGDRFDAYKQSMGPIRKY